MTSGEPPVRPTIAQDGHMLKKGFQPTKAPGIIAPQTPPPQGGHQPITSGGGPGTPPNQPGGSKR